MKKLFVVSLNIFFFLTVLSTVSFSALHSKMPDRPSKVKTFESYGKLPLSFIKNRKQLDRKVSYCLKGRNGIIYFTKEAMVYDLYGMPQDNSKVTSILEHNKPKAFKRFSFIIKPIGASIDIRLTAKNKLPGKVNRLIGNDPKNWQTDCPSL